MLGWNSPTLFRRYWNWVPSKFKKNNRKKLLLIIGVAYLNNTPLSIVKDFEWRRYDGLWVADPRRWLPADTDAVVAIDAYMKAKWLARNIQDEVKTLLTARFYLSSIAFTKPLKNHIIATADDMINAIGKSVPRIAPIWIKTTIWSKKPPTKAPIVPRNRPNNMRNPIGTWSFFFSLTID